MTLSFRTRLFVLASGIVMSVTAHADPKLGLRIFECGAAEFINKPVNAAVLLALVKTHLRMRRMAREVEHLAAAVERHKRQARRDRPALC